MADRTDALRTPGGEPGTAAGVEWANRERLPVVEPSPGVRLRLVAGERAMVSWVDLAPRSSLPLHSHMNEQIGVMVEGTMTIEIGGEARQVGAGDAYVIPPNVRHRVETGDAPCLVIETFAPPRADYVETARRTEGVEGGR
ncbi:MAG TPA: cupin domain-containing protein [Thermomicrobiales bacterium]|nr:cupin domain-containing protein [Thermomicrobiales bacterium]